MVSPLPSCVFCCPAAFVGAFSLGCVCLSCRFLQKKTLAGTATTAWYNDYRASYPTTRTKWVPGPIAQLYKLMHEQHGNKDNQATKVPAIFKAAGKKVLEGPCIFGHTFTTLRCNGKPQWLPNPDPPLWEGTPIGEALCQRCYIQGRTLAARRRREQADCTTIIDNMNLELPSGAKRRRCSQREIAGEATRALKAAPLYPPADEILPARKPTSPAGRNQLTLDTARPPGLQIGGRSCLPAASARPPGAATFSCDFD